MRGMDFWETVRRRRLDRGGGSLKKLRGDWLRLLSDTFETDQSDCCTTRGFRWILLGGVFRKLQESDWMKLQIFFPPLVEPGGDRTRLLIGVRGDT